ncbi:MAG: phosphoglucosamine mutase [Deltaproteobacteria bacterium]|nr:phosphoglucosamine mutase [Deltaproteobacteria bacterium]
MNPPPIDTLPNGNKLFGTDGIRGRANVFPISPDLVLRLGQAVGLYFKKHYAQPKILIGKDTRISGYMLEQALSSGICSTGVDTLFLGPLPTPGIAYLTRGMRANAGIVLSASHNPYHDNGLKIFSSTGFKVPDDVEHEIESLVFSHLDPSYLPTGDEIGKTSRVDDAVGQYAVFLKEQFPKNLSLEGLHIILDCANGAAYKVAPKVFRELGAEVEVIGASPNGTNINEGYGALHPQKLRELVTHRNADIGIAFDGDADRVVVVDEKGELLDGDELLAIFAQSMLAKDKLRHKTVVSTVMSNMGLELALRKMGASLVRTKIGDRYVVEMMRSKQYSLGGEQSGHLIFGDIATTGDGILAALRLLELVLVQGKTVHQLKKVMVKCPQALKNIDVPRRVPLNELPDLSRHIHLVQEKLGNEGRVLFRYSGTELKARIMVEGEIQEHISTLVDELAETALLSIEKHLNARL